MAEIPFPGGAADNDVFFHEDKVCVYHKAINTWECRTVQGSDPVSTAKFDMLRAAIAETTDYETLKARLLAVLQ